MYYNFCKFYIFFHAIPLRNEWTDSFFETWCLKILTVNLTLKCAKSFQTLTSSPQHNNINLFPFTTAWPPTAAIDINNPMHHPTTTSLQQHPCCLPQQPHGRQWQQDGRVEGEWGEWVEEERETGKVMMMQCATHMLHRLFLSLYVVWWHGVQPTCCIIYFIPSMWFDDVACNPHTASSISFSLYIVWWCSVQPTCCIIYFFPSMLFDDVVCNPHAVLSISFCFYFYTYSWILLEVY